MPSKNDARSWKHANLGPVLGLAGLLLTGACAALSASTDEAATPPPGTILKVAVGETKAFTFPGMSKIAVGDPTVADIRSTGKDQLEIIGQGEGKTTLLIWLSEGKRTSYLIAVRK